jgi:phage N-6-adenine-methyltransferase
MSDSDKAYGAICAYLHTAGYTMQRAFIELEPLIEGNDWKKFGFDNIGDFLQSFNFKELHANIETRKRLAKRIQELQPTVSNRKAAEIVGVNRMTVNRDGTNVPLGPEKSQQNQPTGGTNVPLSGTAAANLVTGQVSDATRTRGLNHRAQGTGDNEWFTPSQYIELAKKVLGEIDLDPASCAEAQIGIKAKKFFTKQDDGLSHEWHGRIWLNPPYSQPDIAMFSEKMVKEVLAQHITAAIKLTHNYTDTVWFQLLAQHAQAICFTKGRVRFIDKDGNECSPTQGQAFFYFGKSVGDFAEIFKSIGVIVERYNQQETKNG